MKKSTAATANSGTKTEPIKNRNDWYWPKSSSPASRVAITPMITATIRRSRLGARFCTDMVVE